MAVFKVFILVAVIANVYGYYGLSNVFFNTGQTGSNEKAGEYAEKPNKLWEGDMKLTEIDIALMEGKLQGDAVIGDRYKWPGSVVPYTFNSNLNSRAISALQAAFAEYASKTCVTFKTRTASDPNYIEFFQEQGCWSYIGKIGGKQQISIGNGCEYKSITTHEILHALGFFHEQSRPDRDQYIKINLENIIDGLENQFTKHSSTAYGHPYDYDSVMHYDKTAFTKNGKQTITALKGDPSRDFGQPINGGLSDIDAKQINAHYCASEETKTTTTTTQGTTTQKPVIPTTATPGCTITGGCVDKYKFCVAISRLGFCSSCFVKQNCGLSCAGPDKKRSCPAWAKLGYCTGKYVAFMSGNCKKSCGLTKCTK